MSVAVQINISKDTATPFVAAKIAKCNPHRLATVLAPPLAAHWRDHLKRLPRNRQGYPSTGFWEDAARRVIGIADGSMVRLSSDKLGLRQRLHGGPIRAVNVANLTIPICAEAYGTTAKDWGDSLVLVILADGRKFFALWLGNGQEKPDVIVFKGSGSAATSRASRHMNLKFLFVLVPQTADQAANPNVVPSDLGAAARAKVLEALA